MSSKTDEKEQQDRQEIPQTDDSAKDSHSGIITTLTATGPTQQQIAIPELIPILPLRNAVAFPGTVMPLNIGRHKSKQAVDTALSDNKLIGVLAQRNPEIEDPESSDLYEWGTIALILKLLRMPDGDQTIVTQGLVRFHVLEFTQTQPYLVARISAHADPHVESNTEIDALVHNVRQMARRVIDLSPNVPDEAAMVLSNISEPGALSDFLAANLNLSTPQKQQILETLDVKARLKKVSLALASQLEVLELSSKLQDQVKESISKSQRQYFLQEQLKAIQKELGETDQRTSELEEFRRRVAEAKMPKNVEKEALREIDRMAKIPIASPEYSVAADYVTWLCSLPWAVSTEDNMDIRRAKSVLNADHYDLEKVKKRILQFLAVRKLKPDSRGPILCFVGPPGVGKTSLGQSIARALGRKFIRISLGGMRDEAEIRGHRRTYIGALPGRIMQEIRKCGSNNPVFMLDEVDKLGQDFRGDPASALLEVLDPEQNHTFTDHYLDVPFDLSHVMFIATANYMQPVPPALQDRMEVIEIPGYTQIEKLRIAKKYLLPKQLKENGLDNKKVTFGDDALNRIIDSYTREAGVRNLERQIGSICRAIATKFAEGNKRPVKVTARAVPRYLGPAQYEPEVAMRTSVPGVATGLAYTPVGGQIIFVESTAMPGKGQLILTGQIGDVMKESAQAAYSLLKSRARKLRLDPRQLQETDFHIHVPAGAIPKDGPSAGVAILTSLVSLVTQTPVRSDVAMTGEITLRGLVLPIGGMKEKVLAAKRAGIKTVILPQQNQKDMVDVPKEVQRTMKFVFVKDIDRLLRIALEK